jgi:P4 family phage/plasmid primase-like protien
MTEEGMNDPFGHKCILKDGLFHCPKCQRYVDKAGDWMKGPSKPTPVLIANKLIAMGTWCTMGGRLYHFDKIYRYMDERELSRVVVAFHPPASIQFVQQVRHHLMARTDESTMSKWDIPVANGVLHDEELVPYDPKFKVAFSLPVFYDPAAECPQWEKFLLEVLPAVGDRETIREMFGHCLITHIYGPQKAYVLLGEGANGKSTMLEVLRALLGPENTAAVSLHDLERSQWYTAELDGKLADICADLPIRLLEDQAMFKKLTGGDTINAQRKFEKPFQFVNRARLIFACNSLPSGWDTDSLSWKRRWVVVKFQYVIPEEKREGFDHIVKRLSQELPGIFNWALQGNIRLVNEMHVGVKDEYYDGSDNYGKEKKSEVAGTPVPGTDCQAEKLPAMEEKQDIQPSPQNVGGYIPILDQWRTKRSSGSESHLGSDVHGGNGVRGDLVPKRVSSDRGNGERGNDSSGKILPELGHRENNPKGRGHGARRPKGTRRRLEKTRVGRRKDEKAVNGRVPMAQEGKKHRPGMTWKWAE